MESAFATSSLSLIIKSSVVRNANLVMVMKANVWISVKYVMEEHVRCLQHCQSAWITKTLI